MSNKIPVYTLRDIIYNDLMNCNRITSFRLKLHVYSERERERKKGISPIYTYDADNSDNT